jgi:AcrR family transcriptional regulator
MCELGSVTLKFRSYERGTVTTPMNLRERNKSQRRAVILEAARRLMHDSGNTGFSMRALAEQAGVSLATPYNLFGSKQAILVALLNADFESFQLSLSQLSAGSIDVMFEAVRLTTDNLKRDPRYYRSAMAEITLEAQPEVRHMILGPPYLLWKRLLREAVQMGSLSHSIDLDPFTITLTQLMFATTREWVQGYVSLPEMDARMRYGVALNLLAIATDDSREVLHEHLLMAEADLKGLWQNALMARMKEGPLDAETQEILADQLSQMNPTLQTTQENTA